MRTILKLATVAVAAATRLSTSERLELTNELDTERMPTSTALLQLES